jgi:hypothetical protein
VSVPRQTDPDRAAGRPPSPLSASLPPRPSSYVIDTLENTNRQRQGCFSFPRSMARVHRRSHNTPMSQTVPSPMSKIVFVVVMYLYVQGVGSL